VILLGLLSLVTWAWLIACWNRKEEPIPYVPRRNVPWRFFEVALVIGFVLVSTIAGAATSQEPEVPPTPESFSRNMVASSAIYLVIAGGVALFLLVIRRANARDLGWNMKLPDDLLYGGFGFVSAALPVYLLQILLVQVFEKVRQQHPLLEMLREERRIDLLVMAVFAAVVVAPLVEEFLFRVLLQGWLEKIIAPRAEPVEAELIAPAMSEYETQAIEPQAWDDPLVAQPYAPPAIESPLDAYASPQVELGPRIEDESLQSGEVGFLRMWLPIAISAVLFASAHAGTWPDPVPLFMLALVLGYVYRQTHRLWPSVILHMIFNGLALAMVWFGTD
jgi:membrane protease YdiL (CAAX protease family)